MATAIAFPGFNDLGRTVTPVFLLMDHFLYWFSAFSTQIKKIFWQEVWIFCKMHNRIPYFLALPSSQGSTLTLTRSPLESKVDSVESKKCQLTKNTCLIRPVGFYSLKSSFWCSNRLVEKVMHVVEILQ